MSRIRQPLYDTFECFHELNFLQLNNVRPTEWQYLNSFEENCRARYRAQTSIFGEAMVTPQDKGTSSIALVHEALYSARHRGIDVSLALENACIDPQLLDAPRARVSAGSFARLWVELADLLDDEFFGLDSHPMRRGSFKLMCHALLDCDTLGQALQRMLSFLRLVLDDLHGELHTKEDYALITLQDHGSLRRLFAYGTWFILVHGLACWLVNQRIPLQALSFRAPKPADESDYRMRFCESIQYDARLTQVIFRQEVPGHESYADAR